MADERTGWNKCGWSTETIRLLRASFLLFIAVVAAMVPLLLAESSQLSVLKIFAVVVLSFVPGWLFVRFVVYRSRSVWDEYTLSLHRLGMDEIKHLPQPPENSMYFAAWKEAGGEHEKRESSIYVQKFEAYYGKGTARADDNTKFRADTFFPVLLATAVFSIGWVAVLSRESVFSAKPSIPGDALCYAYMGAYLFTLQMLVRRFFQADLKASAYVNATVRTASALVVALALTLIIRGDNNGDAVAATSFVVGFFLLVGLQALRKAAAVLLRTVVPTLKNDYPLSDLDGLSVWYESRLLELGVEDAQNLATANLVDVILHSRVPVARVVDWVDQAILYLHLEPQHRDKEENAPLSSRDRLRRLGIRSATSPEDAFRQHCGSATSSSISPEANAELIEQLRWALNEAEGKGPSATECVLKTLSSDTNLKHVQRWKQDWRTSAHQPPPQPAPPPTPAPPSVETAHTNGHSVVLSTTSTTIS